MPSLRLGSFQSMSHSRLERAGSIQNRPCMAAMASTSARIRSKVVPARMSPGSAGAIRSMSRVASWVSGSNRLT